MWAEAGRYLPAVGLWQAVIILAIPAIAILGAIAMFIVASKSGIPEGEIRIRPLGIVVRWGQSPRSEQNIKDAQ
jgi:hypothetical protein